MAYKQSPGRGPMMKTGRDIPTSFMSGPAQVSIMDRLKSGFKTAKKVGRTIGDIGSTVGEQLKDFISPDGNKYGGVGSRNDKFAAENAKKIENANHQDIRDRSDAGETYPIAGKIAKFNQDLGYNSSGTDAEYDKEIRAQVTKGRRLRKERAEK